MTFVRNEIQDFKTQEKIVLYTEDTGTVTPFEIRISKQGFTFRGEMSGHVSSEADFQEFARFMSDWCLDTRRLRPRFAKPGDAVDPVV